MYESLVSSLTVGVTECPSTKTIQLFSLSKRSLGIVTLQKPVVPVSPVTLNRNRAPSTGLKLKSETVELLIT